VKHTKPGNNSDGKVKKTKMPGKREIIIIKKHVTRMQC